MKKFAILIASSIVACAPLKENSPGVKKAQTGGEESKIRTVACEAVITNVFRSPGSTIAFVRLHEDELQELRARQPKHEIRSESAAEFVSGLGFRDKRSIQPGVLFSVDWIELRTNSATAWGECFGRGSKVKYEIDLIWDGTWVATNVLQTMIVDFH